MLLSEFLKRQNFAYARRSSEFIGKKQDNPSIILEENIAQWTKVTSLEDLQDCMSVFVENVCVPDFPARYSPQFWLAHSALTAIYNVLCGYVSRMNDIELRRDTDRLLFELWMALISAGPGSSHLEMMDIILKNESCTLWMYMQALKGEDLKLMLTTLKTDFVYKEEVSDDHYATLMETHIDKIFKFILSKRQVEESRRSMLDLYQFYLGKLNHVPPHIGPRLSHLCFLICSRFKMENPYMGLDDWVTMRHHLKLIKDIVTHQTFTKGSEAQYRVPITLEKMFQATIEDHILNIMFKDFTALLETICNHGYSRKCEKLFQAYESGLFEQLDFKKGKGVEGTPDWLFDQCIKILSTISKTVNMEPHIDALIVSAQNLCLLKYTKLNSGQVHAWQNLIMNYIVSGRTLLVKEAEKLISSSVLKENNVVTWKTQLDQGRLLIDIIADLPAEFLQRSEDNTVIVTVQSYSKFISTLLAQFIEQELEGRIRSNVEQCVLKCMEKHVPFKAPIALACLQSEIPNLRDTNYIRDVLFSVENCLKNISEVEVSTEFTRCLAILLKACLEFFRCKGYIAVDMNSLMMSIILHLLVYLSHLPDGDAASMTETDNPNLYKNIALEFVQLHFDKGSMSSIAALVPNTMLEVKDQIQKQGTIPKACIQFLCDVSLSGTQLVEDHVTDLTELFFDWKCFSLEILLSRLWKCNPGAFLATFNELFTKVMSMPREERHRGFQLMKHISDSHGKMFSATLVCQLLGTYQNETNSSRSLVLGILTNIAKETPGHVSAYFSILVDDSKFPVQSLKERAVIFSTLCHHSEELTGKTVDYLLKFVDQKDAEVCIDAMEILQPLFKDHPSFLQKHKTKLKAVWKSAKDSIVKQMCLNILPQIQAMPRKAASTKTNMSREGSSLDKQDKGNTKSVDISSKLVVKAARQKPGNTSVIHVASKSNVSQVQNSAKTNMVAKDSKLNSKESRSSPCLNDSDNKILLPTKHGDQNTDCSNPVRDMGFVPNKGLSVEDGNVKNEKTFTGTFSREAYQQRSVNGDAVARPLGTITVEDVDTASPGDRVLTESLSDEKETLPTAEESDVIEDKSSNEKTEDKTLRKEPEINANVTESCKHNIVLYCSSRCQVLAQSLGSKLAKVGYDNTICVLPQENDGGHLSEVTKVIILCLGANEQELLTAIAGTRGRDGGMFVVKLESMAYQPDKSHALDGTLTFIRLYSKPGEECIAKTAFPRHKFQELLMRINYFGVTTNTGSTPEDISVLWLQKDGKGDTGGRVQRTTNSMVPFPQKEPSYVPDIYISYDWAKQRQVEALYQHLNESGYCCWMAANHLKGSESLYNKITQGIHGCKVVLACATNHYYCDDVCKRDIAMAEALGRPIVPLVFGKTEWPQSGDFQQKLKKYKYLHVRLNSGGLVDVNSENFKRLKQRLDEYKADDSVNNEDRLEAQPDMITVLKSPEGKKNLLDRRHNSLDSSKLQASSSLLEYKTKNSGDEGKRYSHQMSIGHELIFKTGGLPSGVEVDKEGYTLKSARSKSCTIL